MGNNRLRHQADTLNICTVLPDSGPWRMSSWGVGTGKGAAPISATLPYGCTEFLLISAEFRQLMRSYLLLRMAAIRGTRGHGFPPGIAMTAPAPQGAGEEAGGRVGWGR